MLDLFIIDEYLRLPLGRPTVTAVLDRRSRSILGIYIGFEPPSFLSVSKAIKNAISDKTQLIEQYENVRSASGTVGEYSITLLLMLAKI